MKKLLFGVLIVTTTFLYLVFSKYNTKKAAVEEELPEVLGIHLVNNSVSAAVIRVTDPLAIELISNLKDKISSDKAIENYGCKQIVSGGFYSESDKHIGLFETNNQRLSEPITNTLFNGFLHISENRFVIGSENSGDYMTSLQSGPLLLEDKVEALLPKSTDRARRIVAGTNNNGSVLYFMVFFDPKNASLGPSLEELPKMTRQLSDSNNFDITNAINLDGGLHSVYHDGYNKIKESLTSGSFFCIRQTH